MRLLRVKKSALSLKGDEYYFEGTLFNGISYDIKDGVVVEIRRFNDGRPAEEYGDDTFCNMEEKTPVVEDSQLKGESEEEEEPFLYQHKRFDGIAYGFDGDFCVSGIHYENGFFIKEVNWYKNGIIALYESGSENIGEYHVWHQNGDSETIKITVKDIFRLEVDFDKGEKLKRLSISGSYFDHCIAPKEKITHPFVQKASDLKNFKLSDRLFLSGNGIDDSLFDILLSNQNFQKLNELYTFDTSLSTESISKLKENESNNLKRLIFEDDGQELLNALKEYRTAHRGCHIEYNREEILD